MEIKKLKEIAKLTSGYTAREKNNNFSGVYELNSIKSLIIDPQDKHSYTFSGREISPYLLHKNVIIIETRGTYKVGIILCDVDSLTINPNQIKLSITDSNILPLYVCYYLNTLTVKNKLSKLKRGTSTLHLSIRDIESIEVPIVSIKKQQQVIEVINRIEYYKELSHKALEKLELIPTAMFNKLSK